MTIRTSSTWTVAIRPLRTVLSDGLGKSGMDLGSGNHIALHGTRHRLVGVECRRQQPQRLAAMLFEPLIDLAHFPLQHLPCSAWTASAPELRPGAFRASASVGLWDGVFRGEGHQRHGGPRRILEVGRMPDTGEYHDRGAGHGVVLDRVRRAPPAVVLAEDDQ